MPEWTAAAEQEFARYCAAAEAGLAASGAQPAEVFEDLRAHVEREARAAGLMAVTRDDLVSILGRIGPIVAQPDPAPPEPEPPVPAPVAAPAVSRRRVWQEWAAGVVLPVIAIGVEVATGVCASTFFDPLPTLWHLALVCAVPAFAAALLLQLRRGSLVHPRLALLASGLAAGIALFYALPFLVLVPFGIFALILFGLGLLPLTPYLAMAGTLSIAARVWRVAGAGARALGFQALGLVLAGCALMAADLPKSITNIGVKLAASSDPAERARGVALLRRFGSEGVLLRQCYERWPEFELLSPFFGPPRSSDLGPAAIRTLYYRVHGRAFNSVRPPSLSGLRRVDPTTLWDFDQGGEAVGATVAGLALVGSRQDGVIDADAALGYVEWTLEFRNDGVRPAEARAELLLPPGAVVSRVTLWVNGEEREAAFGGRSHVRQAYQAVVNARRDPILVTTAGPDRVLVQCFPVLPGQTMKARVGISAPLAVEPAARGRLLLPRFAARNFALRPELRHGLWFETKSTFVAPPAALALEPLAAGQALRGAVDDTALREALRSVEVARDPERLEAWAAPEPGQPAVRQVLRPRAGAADRLVLVVDGSVAMATAAKALAGVLREVPADVEAALVLAVDEPRVLLPPQRGAIAVDALREVTFTGGQDNLPGLERAWDLAAERERGVVLWIHAAQPERLGSDASLAQRWARRPEGPRLIALAVGDGPNVVLADLEQVPAVSSWPRHGELGADLKALIARATGRLPGLAPEWAEAAAPRDLASRPTSAHVRRLWAFDRVRADLGSADAAVVKAATTIAIAHRLVTPFSGAVVLETQQQYADAGLQPAESQGVPSIPEPETWLLMLVVVSTLVWLRARSGASAA